MPHDPMCQTARNTEMSEAFCDCDLIARVEERTQDKWTVIARGQYDLALRDAMEAVKTMRDGTTRSSVAHSVLNQAVAAIEGLEVEQ